MPKLTPMRRSGNFYEKTIDVFGGYDRRREAPEGSLWDVQDMTCDCYPALTVRDRRGQKDYAGTPNGLMARDCLVWVAGKTLYVDGKEAAQLTDSRKILVGIQKKICIWPDKKIYDRNTGKLTSMEASWTGNADIADGTFGGEPATANTLSASADLTGLFKKGDGVSITVQGGQTLGASVIQELELQNGKTALRFHENVFQGMTGTGKQVTIRRSAPDVDLAFEHHSRIWCASGGTIRCSALGDPTNWEKFDGISTDSWELHTGSPGNITGGISFGGRPVFFKERRIIRIYGDAPGQYSTSETEDIGVEQGSSGSLAVAGGALLYKSSEGVMAYSGGTPYSISDQLGGARFVNAVAGSDGVKYYISMQVPDGKWALFCYDTRHRIWHRENSGQVLDFGWYGDLYALESSGAIFAYGTPRHTPTNELGTVSMVEFNDFDYGDTRTNGLRRIILSLEADHGVTLKISIQYDSDGIWHELRSITGPLAKGQEEIQLRIRRCRHYRIRIDGRQNDGSKWTLYGLTWERRTGSRKS